QTPGEITLALANGSTFAHVHPQRHQLQVRQHVVEEGLHSEGVLLTGIFETCCELHPADFILFLLTAPSKLPSAGRAWEKAVLKALDRPLDSVILDDNSDIVGFSAPTWIKSKGPWSRQR